MLQHFNFSQGRQSKLLLSRKRLWDQVNSQKFKKIIGLLNQLLNDTRSKKGMKRWMRITHLIFFKELTRQDTIWIHIQQLWRWTIRDKKTINRGWSKKQKQKKLSRNRKKLLQQNFIRKIIALGQVERCLLICYEKEKKWKFYWIPWY